MTMHETVPAHVPQELVRDFDYFHVPPGQDGDIQRSLLGQFADREIFFTPRYGGHWVVTSADVIKDVLRNFDVFSSNHISIPATPRMKLPLMEYDPPAHTAYRSVLAPLLTPAAIAELEPMMAEIAIDIVDRLKPQGQCEFIGDFAREMPIRVFLRLMGLPEEDRFRLLPSADTINRGGGDNPDAVADGFLPLIGYIQEKIDTCPAHGLLSKIGHANIEVNGRVVERDELVLYGALLVAGGLDSVPATMGFVQRFLALNPSHRQQLVNNPALIPRALEELLRRQGIMNIGRQIRADVVYRGVAMKAGDMILVPSCLFGLDEALHADPLTVDFNREKTTHVYFGAGPHRCVGAHLARTELQLYLREWLARIPDFRLKSAEIPMPRSGSTYTLDELPLVWDNN